MTQSKQLSLEPQNIDKDTWYYEMPRGILLVHWMHIPIEQNGKTSTITKSIEIPIPWKMLKKSLARAEGLPDK